jgi:hypothetical protein
MGEMATVNSSAPIGYRPADHEVSDLLARASRHPLGTTLLADGALDAVAATFGVHAFVVEAAREALLDRA